MKKALSLILVIVMVCGLLTACVPGISGVNSSPKNLRIVCPGPKAGTAVRDAEFSMTGQKEGTEYTLVWTVDYDGLHSETLSEGDIFCASYIYHVTVQYEMDKDRTAENTTVELASESGTVQTTTADGTHWTTVIGFGTLDYSASIYISASNPVMGVAAKDLGANVTLDTEELDCTWKWTAVLKDGTENTVKDTETLPEDAEKYTIYVSFLLPEGYTSETVFICIDSDAKLGKVYTDEKGNTVVPVSYENLLEESETEVTIGKARVGMTVAELAETVSVTVDGNPAEVYGLYVGGSGANFMDETAVLGADTYVARINFEGKEEWGCTMSPAAMGLKISDGYVPKNLVLYGGTNFGLWVTFTLEDDTSAVINMEDDTPVVISMAVPKVGDTVDDIFQTASVTINGEKREIYNLFWMYDAQNWLENGSQITPGTYTGRLDFEGSEDWNSETELEDINITISDGYTLTDLELWAELNYGVYFTFTIEESSSGTSQELQTPAREHIHEFAYTEGQNATCTEDGYILYTCQCGETYRETLPATGHHFTWQCSPAFYGHYAYCSGCGMQGELEDHDIQEDETHQWCTKCGYVEYFGE